MGGGEGRASQLKAADSVAARCHRLVGLYHRAGTLARGVKLGLRNGAGINDQRARLVIAGAKVVVGHDVLVALRVHGQHTKVTLWSRSVNASLSMIAVRR
jgi:hypothetical protein